jgi:protocadherin Fat 4
MSTPFSMNRSTGEITVSTASGLNLDRERMDIYELHVVATDSSDFLRLSSECNVTVRIADVNDNSPRIENDNTDFFIPPTTVAGSFVLGVLASDDDLGRNGDLSFSLSGGRDDRNFNIAPSNGVITASPEFSQKVSYQIIVRVSDNGDKRLSADKKFEIFLAKELSVPDFAPSFKDRLKLDEDVSVGSVIAGLEATESNVAFGIAGGNTFDTFAVHNTTGELIIARELDYEILKYFELWVKVYYETKPLFFRARKIVIDVEDKNDNAPEFRDVVSRISVVEGLYPPFRLTELIAFDRDEGKNGEIGFQMIAGDSEDIFEVEESTGVLLCNRELDREKISEYQLKVLAFDHGSPSLSSTATVLLTVEDLNDNAPLFRRLYNANVTENTPPGTKLLTVETNDLDTPANANVTYTLLGDDDDRTFEINPSSGLITVRKNLDREVREEYALKVQASDGAWKLDTTISVLVQDENDNLPVFDHDIYQFTLPYSTAMAYKDLTEKNMPYIGRVHALDRDATGPNSALIYTLSHRSEFFSLDGQSGKIRVKSNLPFNRRTDSHGLSGDNIYQLRVLATDQGSPPRSSECEVKIAVVGGNDHDPMFKSGGRTEFALPRALPLGTVVTTLQATDEDGENGTNEVLDFAIVGPKEAKAMFEIDTVSGAIRTKRSLEGLAGLGEVRLNVSVTDRGIPKKTSYATLLFSLTDANIHAPEFQSSATRIYIREDEPIGNTIITLSAADKDSGANGKLTYFIVKGDTMGMFRVDKDSGRIMVNRSLDYEKIPVYNVVVKAKDLGYNSKSASASVKIVLQDVNDNVPYFEESVLVAGIVENAPTGTLVTQVIALDLDSPKYGQIEYAIVEKQRDFEIDPNTGIVVSSKSFDFEYVSAYSLTVTAKNPDSDAVSKAVLKIKIQGENEFVPKFRQPVFQFAVSEASTVGITIGRVEADDADEGEEGVISYFFVGASNSAGFGIDHKTGVIFVNERLDRESQNRYVLTVLAKNRGSIRGDDIDEAQVIIQVQDGNDPPVFRREFYSADVSEDATIGTEVATVSAVDKDVRPRNSHFSYSLATGTGNDKFSISPSTGVISVAAALDREVSPGGYNLTVHAIDNGSPPATGSATVLVQLGDVNDSPPSLKETIGNIKENSPVGSFIMQLTAVDADLPHNAGPFQFKLIQGSDKVELEERTGTLRSKLVYDRERIPDFRVKVQIIDSGSPALTSVGNIRGNFLSVDIFLII